MLKLCVESSVAVDREAIRSKLVKIMSHSHRGGSRNDMADGPSPEEEGLLGMCFVLCSVCMSDVVSDALLYFVQIVQP